MNTLNEIGYLRRENVRLRRALREMIDEDDLYEAVCVEETENAGKPTDECESR